jgi:hypothetical protein
MYLLVIIHHFCDQIPKRNNLKEEGFIVACGFRGFSPCWLTPFFLGYGEAEHHDESKRKQRCSLYGSQEAETGRGQARVILQRFSPSDLSSNQAHLPYFHCLLIVYSDFESLSGWAD